MESATKLSRQAKLLKRFCYLTLTFIPKTWLYFQFEVNGAYIHEQFSEFPYN